MLTCPWISWWWLLSYLCLSEWRDVTTMLLLWWIADWDLSLRGVG
jgi:hypothetical protein